MVDYYSHPWETLAISASSVIVAGVLFADALALHSCIMTAEELSQHGSFEGVKWLGWFILPCLETLAYLPVLGEAYEGMTELAISHAFRSVWYVIPFPLLDAIANRCPFQSYSMLLSPAVAIITAAVNNTKHFLEFSALQIVMVIAAVVASTIVAWTADRSRLFETVSAFYLLLLFVVVAVLAWQVDQAAAGSHSGAGGDKGQEM